MLHDWWLLKKDSAPRSYVKKPSGAPCFAVSGSGGMKSLVFIGRVNTRVSSVQLAGGHAVYF
jgi:hypothetical protein